MEPALFGLQAPHSALPSRTRGERRPAPGRHAESLLTLFPQRSQRGATTSPGFPYAKSHCSTRAVPALLRRKPQPTSLSSRCPPSTPPSAGDHRPFQRHRPTSSDGRLRTAGRGAAAPGPPSLGSHWPVDMNSPCDWCSLLSICAAGCSPLAARRRGEARVLCLNRGRRGAGGGSCHVAAGAARPEGGEVRQSPEPLGNGRRLLLRRGAAAGSLCPARRKRDRGVGAAGSAARERKGRDAGRQPRGGVRNSRG